MRENYATEIKTLTQYMQVHPESMLFARLAERYLQMQEIDKATEICQRGLRNHPNYVSGHFILAKCLLARHLYGEAEKRLKHVISLERNFLPAHKLIGELMGSVGQIPQQRTRFQYIQQKDPLYPIELPKVSEPPVPEPLVPEAPVFELPVSNLPVLEPVTFAPSAEKPVPQPDVVLQDLVHIPEDEEPIPDFDSASFFGPQPGPGLPPIVEQKMEVDTLPEIDESEIVNAESSDFEKEEMRFSLILDDLFSPNLADEEQRDREARTTLERAAESELQSPPSATEPHVATAKETPQQPATIQPKGLAQEPIQPKDEDLQRAREFEDNLLRMQNVVPPAPAPTKEDHDESAFEEEPESPLPAYGPDFSAMPQSTEDQDINDFVDHLDRIGGREEDELARAESNSDTEDTISFDAPLEEPFDADQDDLDSIDIRTGKPKEKFVTPTLGEIYAAQGQYAKAISVFEMLMKKNPENEWYRTKLEYLRKRLQEEKS